MQRHSPSLADLQAKFPVPSSIEMPFGACEGHSGELCPACQAWASLGHRKKGIPKMVIKLML